MPELIETGTDAPRQTDRRSILRAMAGTSIRRMIIVWSVALTVVYTVYEIMSEPLRDLSLLSFAYAFGASGLILISTAVMLFAFALYERREVVPFRGKDALFILLAALVIAVIVIAPKLDVAVIPGIVAGYILVATVFACWYMAAVLLIGTGRGLAGLGRWIAGPK